MDTLIFCSITRESQSMSDYNQQVMRKDHKIRHHEGWFGQWWQWHSLWLRIIATIESKFSVLSFKSSWTFLLMHEHIPSHLHIKNHLHLHLHSWNYPWQPNTYPAHNSQLLFATISLCIHRNIIPVSKDIYCCRFWLLPFCSEITVQQKMNRF